MVNVLLGVFWRSRVLAGLTKKLLSSAHGMILFGWEINTYS